MDANSFQNEKLNITNLLFTKAIPNYTLPISTDGRPVFACTDCGDKFIIKSSYEYHIKRKSLKITYFCRHCNIAKIFFNRCDLLCHIRSHVFNTATLSITDLKIEPLPLFYYNNYNNDMCGNTVEPSVPSSVNQDDTEVQNKRQTVICFDCKTDISSSGITHLDRAKHYSQYKNVYSCPVCLLALTTRCALETHLRIHTREPPYYCTDCGKSLTKSAVLYPYGHYCESFKMMRATIKVKCSVTNCNKILHPTESVKHLRSYHLKTILKCPNCNVACYKLENMLKHYSNNHALPTGKSKKFKHIEFLHCEMCPGRLIIPNQIDKHLKNHEHDFINSVYPCWTCGQYFTLAKNLLEHQKFQHSNISAEKVLSKVRQETITTNAQNRTKGWFHRKANRCMKCNQIVSQGVANFLCKCKDDSTPKIVCNLCKRTIRQDWNVIKKHYAIYHKEHVCLDVKIILKKICTDKNRRAIKTSKQHKKKSHDENVFHNVTNNYISSDISKDLIVMDGDKFNCSKCGQNYENKEIFEKHIVEHRDPFMAYQCVECGESFVTKPSFSTHLLLKHGINDVNNYIDEKKCYNEESLYLQKPIITENIEPLKENQCNICREEFSNQTDFKKHFRVHGMAFLMKNTNKPTSPEKI